MVKNAAIKLCADISHRFAYCGQFFQAAGTFAFTDNITSDNLH